MLLHKEDIMRCNSMVVFLNSLIPGAESFEDGHILRTAHDIGGLGKVYVVVPDEDMARVAEVCRRCSADQCVKMYVDGEIVVSHVATSNNAPCYKFILQVSRIDQLVKDPVKLEVR